MGVFIETCKFFSQSPLKYSRWERKISLGVHWRRHDDDEQADEDVHKNTFLSLQM